MKGSHTPARSLQRPPCTGPQPGPSPGAGALHAGRWPQTRWMGQHARSPRSGACHGEGAGSWLPVLTRARSRGPAVATGACFPPGLPELRPLHVRPRLSAASRGLRHCPTGAWGPATLRPNRPWPQGPYMASTSRADRLCGSVARGLSRDVAQGGEETDIRRGRGRQRSTQPRCPRRVPGTPRGAWRCRARPGRGARCPSGECVPPPPACRVRGRPLRRVLRFPGRRPPSLRGQLGRTALSPSPGGAGVAGWPRGVAAPAAAGPRVSFERDPIPCGPEQRGCVERVRGADGASRCGGFRWPCRNPRQGRGKRQTFKKRHAAQVRVSQLPPCGFGSPCPHP